MYISIIGAGNVGTVLGRVLTGLGYTIRQVFSREYANAARLAEELGAEAVQDPELIDKRSDVYIIAVTDDAVADLAAKLVLDDQLVIHTAGSVSREVLSRTSSNYGVLWPMKMLRKPMTGPGAVTTVIDGSSPSVVSRIEKIAKQFSEHVLYAGDEQRLKMHAVAVMVSNFTNHMYHLAADYCEKEGIDFASFHTIIEESARQVQHAHPSEVQAGPAFRNDTGTMEKHRQLLTGYPALARLYDVLSDSIIEKHTR